MSNKSAPVSVATKVSGAKTEPKKQAEKKAATPESATSAGESVPCKEDLNPVLQQELRRQAELIVAADDLLCDLERRTEPLTASQLKLTVAEKALISTGLPWLENLHDIAKQLEVKRGARLLLEQGASLASIDAAQAALDEAVAAEAKLNESFENIENKEGERLKEFLASRVDGLREAGNAISEAERLLASEKNRYQSLLGSAPRILKDHYPNTVSEVAPHADQEINDLRRKLSKTQLIAKKLGGFKAEAGDQASRHALISSWCPDAVYMDRNAQIARIRESVCHTRAQELQDEVIPKLERELQSLLEEREAVLSKSMGPYHQWALTGRLAVDMLLYH